MSETTIDDIRNEATALISRYALRDEMLEDIRKMFHMEWTDLPSGDWIKATMSPSAYNAVIGAVRLMTSTEPQISVPFDESDGQQKRSSETIEKACKAMWNGSGRVSMRPVHYDAILSGFLFAEICGSVSKTSDLVEYAEKSKNKARIARMKHVASRTPYLFKFYDPATCYPDYDTFGLRAMVRRVETSWSDVLAAWGELAEDAMGVDKKPGEKVTLNDWYDWEYRAVWLDKCTKPILCEPHELGFLPIVCQITDGTALFDDPELCRFPLLYPVWKSGLWRRENLSLTTVYSLIHALGSNPLLLRKTNSPGAPITINRSIPGGIVDLLPDEQLAPLMEKVVDPSQMQGLQMAGNLIEQSTISKQALGSPPTSGMSFSAISLLTQSGRLPLMGVKQMGAQAIANMLIAALTWYKQGAKGAGKLKYKNEAIELHPDDIDEYPVLNVNLEPDLPQDKLQLAQIAAMLKNANLASTRWVQENILQIGQSQAMTKEIWMEQRQDAEKQKALAMVQAQGQAMAQMQTQAMQQAMQAQQAQQAQSQPQPPQEQLATPESAMSPTGAPEQAQDQPKLEGLPPDQMMALLQRLKGGSALPPGGQVQPGAPLSGPLPPRGQA